MKTRQASKIKKHLLSNRRPKSKWDFGVLVTVFWLLDNYERETITREGLLNGAKDWKQFSYGGGYLIYDADIAKLLCTPSELNKTRGGELPPNSGETWLDVHARALHQASEIILSNL